MVHGSMYVCFRIDSFFSIPNFLSVKDNSFTTLHNVWFWFILEFVCCHIFILCYLLIVQTQKNISKIVLFWCVCLIFLLGNCLLPNDLCLMYFCFIHHYYTIMQAKFQQNKKCIKIFEIKFVLKIMYKMFLNKPSHIIILTNINIFF